MVNYDIRTGVKKIKTKTTAAFGLVAAIGASAVMIGAMTAPALATKTQGDFGPTPSTSANGRVPLLYTTQITDKNDTGTCDNTWALDSYTKQYKLLPNGDGTYDLNINYVNGTFTTIGELSPGACESTPIGTTVVAGGITGRMHEEWSTTVTASIPPNYSFICDSSCTSATGFLNAVFGNSGYTPIPWSDWTWNGHYEAGSHGVWYDTSTNYPSGDRGDIN